MRGGGCKKFEDIYDQVVIASTTSLTPRRHRTVSYGRRLLDTAASVLWNSLPNDLKCTTNLINFKNHVKTFPFAL